MTTKKQKHEAALAKREKFLKYFRQDGLQAQKQNRERREYEQEIISKKLYEVNRRNQALLTQHDEEEAD